MQPFHEIGKLAIKIELNGFFDVCNIGDYRFNAAAFQALVSAPAHAPGDKHLAIIDTLSHGGMP